MDQKEGGTHGNVVWVFSNSEMNTNVTNDCYKQVECKTQIKNVITYLFPMFPPWIMVLKFCADPSKKSKSVKAIYIYASERSCYALPENGNYLLCYDLLFWKY